MAEHEKTEMKDLIAASSRLLERTKELNNAVRVTYENNWSDKGRHKLFETPQTIHELRTMIEYARASYPENDATAIVEALLY